MPEFTSVRLNWPEAMAGLSPVRRLPYDCNPGRPGLIPRAQPELKPAEWPSITTATDLRRLASMGIRSNLSELHEG